MPDFKLNRSAQMMVGIGAIALVLFLYKADSRLREMAEIQREMNYQTRAMRYELETQNPEHPRGGLGEDEERNDELGEEELRVNVDAGTIEDTEWVRDALAETDDRELLLDARDLCPDGSNLAKYIDQQLERFGENEDLDGDFKMQVMDPEEETVEEVDLDGLTAPDEDKPSAVDDEFEVEVADPDLSDDEDEGEDSNFVSAEELAGN